MSDIVDRLQSRLDKSSPDAVTLALVNPALLRDAITEIKALRESKAYWRWEATGEE